MINDIFINNLPSIDLHGLDRNMAKLEINDFINESIIKKNERIVIIHGIGTGILRKTTRDILKNDKRIIKYQTSFFNQGVTIVDIRL